MDTKKVQPIERKHGLIIERKVREAIVLETSEGILEITLISIHGKSARLLFSNTTGERIPIVRKEIYNVPVERRGPR